MITKLKVRMYGDPCLRQKSAPVKDVGPAERLLIQSMIKTMYSEKGIGLAAPQVGINQRIFVADIGDGPVAVINPRIVKRAGTESMEEGCLSIPGVQVPVKRAQKILVRYMDEHHQPIEATYEGLMARVFLHELDHLDGKMIVDYAGVKLKIKLRSQLKDIQGRVQKL